MQTLSAPPRFAGEQRNPLKKAIASAEASLAQFGPLTALHPEMSLWRQSRTREKELAAARKAAAAPGIARPAVAAPGMARLAASAAKVPSAPVPTAPKNADAAAAGTDAELYDYYCTADVHDSNRLSSNPDTWQRIKNESQRRHLKR